MKHVTRYLAWIPAGFALVASPVMAAERSVTSSEPVKLTDSELDEVTGGGLLNFNVTIQNASFVFQLNNVAVNTATVIQVSILGGSFQWAQAIAIQSVTP